MLGEAWSISESTIRRTEASAGVKLRAPSKVVSSHLWGTMPIQVSTVLVGAGEHAIRKQ